MRLIDADALKEQVCLDGDCTQCKTGVNEKVCKWNMVQLNDAIERLESAPTIDAVPVVRCKDCKCWTEWDNGTGSCSRFALDWIGTDADDFCSMGERKDDESERD